MVAQKSDHRLPRELTRMRITQKVNLAIGLSLLAAVAGCGSGGAGPGPALLPASTIIVDGSSTVYRISVAARDAFKSVDPAVVVVVDYHGTGAGFKRYLEGEVDVIDASLPKRARNPRPRPRESSGRGSWWVTTESRWLSIPRTIL